MYIYFCQIRTMYPPDLAENSPVYLSHHKLCLSFTKMKCVSVRNNSMLPSFPLYDDFYAACGTSSLRKSAYDRHFAILLAYIRLTTGSYNIQYI